MADAIAGFEVDKKLLTTLVVFVVVIIVLWMLYMKFGSSKPTGALTTEEYGKLSATDQALYEKRTDGYYYKKA